MAAVVTEARKNGARIPWSYWRDRPLTAEQYLAEPTLADPICRLDCDIPVDGVATFVLSSAERARDLPNRPVYVAGYASSTGGPRRLPCTGRSTISSTVGRTPSKGSGVKPDSRSTTSTCRRSTTVSHRSFGFGSSRSASARRARRIASSKKAASTVTTRRPSRLYRAEAR